MKSNYIKKHFRSHFEQKMRKEGVLTLFNDIFALGEGYVVGGFFRDFIEKKEESRDIDIIIDVDFITLQKIIDSYSLSYEVNRHKGIKIKLNAIEIDIWTFNNNWAFKNNLVKVNANKKLDSIARGCFYNYDGLVINLKDFSYNLRYYRDFKNKNMLNIFQKNQVYKNLNPSVEANILRAIFIKNKFESTFSDHTSYYLYKKIGDIQDKYGDVLKRLLEVKKTYSKYNCLLNSDIEDFITNFRADFSYKNQKLINI
ncbi:MAG: hypothetical protein ACFNP4_04935 [Capnocytophaga gingivalis]|uniref:hypothetical protein n=1 Tax=Capnocytophaga gingivalis TaxID=1017 RepID=UPI00361340CF